MERQLGQLEEFHAAFGQDYRHHPAVDVPMDVLVLRHRLIIEELDEYVEAVQGGDIVDVADDLTDLLYVVYGTVIVHGLQELAVRLFDEVHRSNMSKLGPDGRPIHRKDGKPLKPDNWSPPDLLVHHRRMSSPWLSRAPVCPIRCNS